MGPANQPALPTLPLGLPAAAAAAARCSKAEHLHAAAAAVQCQPAAAAAAVFPRKLLLAELFAAKLQPTDELFSSK